MKKNRSTFYCLLFSAALFVISGCSKQNPDKDYNKPSTPVSAVGDSDDAPAQPMGVDASHSSFEDAASDALSLEALNRAPANHLYYFAFDSSTIDAHYKASVKAQARFLLAHPRARLRLEGHTDERGSREYNISLGWERAKSVARMIKELGVSSQQIVLVSYGKERPLDSGSNPRAWQKNRRVALVYENK